MKTAPQMSPQERYKKLLEKVSSLNLGGGGWWRPPTGTSTIRILPAVGTMDYFFVEVGQHYLTEGGKPFYCPNICSEGKLPCPICEVNEELYKAGEKEAAGRFRASRAFFMNIIDRSNPGQGVLKFAPGTTIFQALASAIGDPDYGDISDAQDGYDIKIERTGEGREGTKYQTRPTKRSTPLADTDEQIEEWLNDADDLKAFVDEQLLSYDDLAEKSGVNVFFAEDEEEPQPKAKAPAASKRAIPEPDDEEEPPARGSAAERINRMQADREKRTQLLKHGR